MKLRIALGIFLFISIITNSQIVFEKGYLIDNKKNKTECWIKNVDWNYNPTSILYKTKENGAIETANLSDIKQFEIYNFSKYIKFDILVDNSSSSLSQLSNSRTPSFVKETHFLKVLVEGDASLYSLTKKDQLFFFIKSSSTPITQLIRKSYILPEEGIIRENNSYKNQLRVALNNEAINRNTFKKIDYNKKELIHLFIKYNESKNTHYVNYEQKPEREPYHLVLLSGVSFSSFSASNDTSSRKMDFESTSNFAIGLENEFTLPYNKNKWSVLLEAVYQNYTSTSKNEGVATKDIGYKRIELGVGLRHSFFFNKHSKMYVNAHYISSFDFSSKISYPETDLYDIRANGTLALGLGYQLKKYSISIRHDFSKNLLTSNVSWDSSFNKTSLFIGYQFL